MKLYHVSTQNKNKKIIDMKKSIKDDMRFVGFLLDRIKGFDDFNQAYNSEFMQISSKKRGWIAQKIVAEAIFEFIRQKDYPSSPSRLMYSYFTDSVEKAKYFNKKERENEGDYFVFEADEEKVYYYDMDVFNAAVKVLEKQGLTEQSFEKVKEFARTYWLTSEEGNTEILYKGSPVLENITEFVKSSSI